MLYTPDSMKAYVYAVFGALEKPECDDIKRYNPSFNPRYNYKPIYHIADCGALRLKRVGVVERIRVQQDSTSINSLEYGMDVVQLDRPFPKLSPMTLVVILMGKHVSKLNERHMVHVLESRSLRLTGSGNVLSLNELVKFRSEGIVLDNFEVDPRLMELAIREAHQVKYEDEHGCPSKNNYVTINPDWDEETTKKIGTAIRAGWEKINHSLKKMGDEQKGEGNMVFMPRIEKVIFNDPATIVYWKDGTKTVVKANKSGKKKDQDEFREDYGLAMAIAKKYAGTRSRFERMVENRNDGE